uniref:Protein kinase domain-containing protein n=1 Tax=Rhodnius prolixus TaxID=13249 RepID=T1HBB5_RHOPR
MSAFNSPNFDGRKRGGKHFQVPSTPNLKLIGHGTGVHVYQWDRSGRRDIEQSPWALKKAFKEYSRPLITKRMEIEANILKKMDHPNIVLAMEECGISLGDLIENRNENKLGPFEPSLILKVILSVCKGLHYLHTEKKIIHGDLKSYNILIKGDFNQIKLCDFGVSFPIGDDGEIEDYVGTLCWSAPEVLVSGPITAKADIFALGLTIWEMLSLRPPHSPSDECCEQIESNTLSENDFRSEREYAYGKFLNYFYIDIDRKTKPLRPKLSLPLKICRKQSSFVCMCDCVGE